MAIVIPVVVGVILLSSAAASASPAAPVLLRVEATTTEESPSTPYPAPPVTPSTPAELAVFDPGPCIGAYVTASGSGFTVGEPIVLSRDGVPLTTVPAGADGTFDVRVDISTVQNGDHVVSALGVDSGYTASGTFAVVSQVCETGGSAVASVHVTSADVDDTSSDANAVVLATTGFPTATLVGIAALALLAGAGILYAVRRRRIGTDSPAGPPLH